MDCDHLYSGFLQHDPPPNHHQNCSVSEKLPSCYSRFSVNSILEFGGGGAGGGGTNESIQQTNGALSASELQQQSRENHANNNNSLPGDNSNVLGCCHMNSDHHQSLKNDSSGSDDLQQDCDKMNCLPQNTSHEDNRGMFLEKINIYSLN